MRPRRRNAATSVRHADGTITPLCCHGADLRAGVIGLRPNNPTPEAYVTASPLRALTGMSLLAAAAAPVLAFADTPNCADVSDGAPIIYGSGATGPRDLIGEMAFVLENASDPVVVVYQDQGACTGPYALAGLAPSTLTGSANYWDPNTGAKTACNLPIEGVAVDFAFTDVRAENCPLINYDDSLLVGLLELQGAVNPVSVLVPVGSSQQVISSEAFYLVYGLGAAAGIEPWTSQDPTYFQRRNDDSGTQLMISLAAGIPTNKYVGTDAGGGSALVSNLAALTTPEAGIGFATASTADGHRDVVRNLAWQQAGQDVGYWPDSTSSTFDKANVRSGQYNVWANVDFYAYEGGTAGSFSDPDVQVLGEYFAGISQPAGASETITEASTKKKLVPVCAMHVARDTDLGPMYAAEPDEPCGCYFDYTNTGATTCQTCDDSTPCSGADVCRLGFCEAQ